MLTENKYSACVLVGVWGKKFIDDFFDISLPTLLAPGNIPALIKQYPTKFVFLTCSYDVKIFEDNPALQKLKAICEVEFITMDDLIVVGNYSTTLTFSYDRAIKKAGEKMLSTYFIFLTSDYIMADGSMEGLMRYMQRGYSGICAGNFQVIEEEVKPYLEDLVDPDTNILQISPRKLLEKSLQHLHPVTVTSFLDQTIVRNYHANRFFVYHDPFTIAGRFYLLHMLCIKPERRNYKIGSSCDYSFIPEMCPSGNIAIINDSDDYLVVEMQPRSHEINYVKSGSYVLRKLAHGLQEWTTVQHRENAKHTIYYHAREMTEALKQQLHERLEQYITAITAKLKKPKPYYMHPYWIGACRSFNSQKGIIRQEDASYIDVSWKSATFKKKLFFNVFGRLPEVFPWHFRYREYKAVADSLRKHLAGVDNSMAIALYASYQTPFMNYSRWLTKTFGMSEHHFIPSLLGLAEEVKKLESTKREICVCFAQYYDLPTVVKMLPTIKRFLKPNGKLLLYVPNHLNQCSRLSYNFQAEFSFKVHRLKCEGYQVQSTEGIYNNFTFYGMWLVSYLETFFEKQRHLHLVMGLIGIPGCLLTTICNCLPRFLKRKSGHCVGIFTTLTPLEARESHEI